MRICFFGDSFVNGTGDDDALGWVGRLVAKARQGGRDVTAYNPGCYAVVADAVSSWRSWRDWLAVSGVVLNRHVPEA